MLLQEVAEGEDRGFIRDPVADQLDAGKAAHVRHVVVMELHAEQAKSDECRQPACLSAELGHPTKTTAEKWLNQGWPCSVIPLR